MQHRIETLDGFAVVGLACECTHEDTSAIEPLWKSFEKYMCQIQGITGMYGACWDKPDGFTYMACAGVSTGASVPEGLLKRDVPASKYAVYSFNDKPEEMKNVFTDIFEKHLHSAGLKYNEGGVVLERYPEDCMDEVSGKLKADLLIPIK